uniref:SET domain-containing protein n=1 Tax=Panagrolaimus superbus TaxID=310955 RepID=A0A914Z682_9BILA
MDEIALNKIIEVAQTDVLNQSNPEPRPPRNPEEELLSWKFRNLPCGKSTTSLKTRILSNNGPCCKTPFEELKPIKLCDMKVPMVHSGGYLVCQIVAKPFSIVGVIPPTPVIGIHTLIKDLNGDVEEATLFNLGYNVDEIDFLPFGTILIIKEPCLQYASQNKAASLRVDSPSDIIFVDPTDFDLLDKIGAKQWYESNLSKDAELWQEKANKFFKKEKYEMALKLYDRAIRCNPELSVLYLNKALTCLRIGAFYKAYETAKLALEKGGDREKALYRMGQAAYGMREWQKAANHFVEVLKEFPKNVTVGGDLKRATARLAEQKYGKYDFKAMLLQSKKQKPQLDVADYVGPIEIANIPGKGRGIVATKNIKEGTLLAVEKAFSSGFSQDFPVSLEPVFLGDLSAQAQMLQVIQTMKNLQNNPQKAEELYGLYAGDEMKQTENVPPGIIDAAKIQQICSLNRWGSGCDNLANVYNLDGQLQEDTENSNLFILPSYFNHSCLANSFRTFYGDVIVIHATEDIKKGDEISIAYLYPLNGYQFRKKRIDSWKFECHCKLCELDASDKNCLIRDRMIEELDEHKKSGSPYSVIIKGETLLSKIRESYVDRKELKIV